MKTKPTITFFDVIDYSKMQPGTAWGVVIQKCPTCKRLGKVGDYGAMIHQLKLATQGKQFNEVIHCRSRL